MGRIKVDGNGDRIGAARGLQHQSRSTSEQQSNLQKLSSNEERAASVGRSTALLADMDGGYLKIRRDALGADVHLTWTWVVGHWSGHYVYSRVPWWELDYGLELLIGKVEQVEEGRMNPTPDKRSPK